MSSLETRQLSRQAASDTEAIRIAKNLLKLVKEQVEAGNEFCTQLFVQAYHDAKAEGGQ